MNYKMEQIYNDLASNKEWLTRYERVAHSLYLDMRFDLEHKEVHDSLTKANIIALLHLLEHSDYKIMKVPTLVNSAEVLQFKRKD